MLSKCLSVLYNSMLKHCCVPDNFKIGVIVPILKKSSLNPNICTNYRPITLSSVHTKIIELLMLPKYEVSDNQFGFRTKRGTAVGCTLLNDVMCYCNHKKSPLYVCSLDAEKCFDSIWHPALCYKLKDKISHTFWLFLVKWYKGLRDVINLVITVIYLQLPAVQGRAVHCHHNYLIFL